METQKINEVIETSTKWLLDQQNEDGGWAERIGQKINVLNTAEAIIALMDGGRINNKKINPGHIKIKNAVNFLLRKQSKNGSWTREVIAGSGKHYEIPDILRTSFVIRSLIKVGIGISDVPIKKSVKWLIKNRNKNHGWGYKKDDPSELMPTCLVLLAFLELYQASDKDITYKEIIDRGLQLLVSWQNEADGSFENKSQLKAAYTIYGTLVLQAATRGEINPYAKREKKAIEWLLENRDQTMMVTEELVKIDAEDKNNYGFLFMTDTLLLTVLMDHEPSENYIKKAVFETLLNIKQKRDLSGGFHGYRVFSWSTAKVLSALATVTQDYKKFPEITPIVKGYNIGKAIIILVMIIIIITSILIIIGDLKPWHAIFFLLLMLPVLLANKLIGEKTFTELFKFGLKGIGKDQ